MYNADNIYCCDAYVAIKQIQDKSVDLIVTDPPYLMDDHGGGGAFGNDHRAYQNEIDILANGISNELLTEFVRVMKRVNIYIFCNKNQLRQYLNFFDNYNTDILVLYKTNPIPRINNKYLSDLEYCVFARDSGVPMWNTYETSSKLWQMTANKQDKEKFKHPTIKPLRFIENLIINSSKEGDLVFDPFVGSGTTAVAAKNLGRHYLGFEINPKWAKIAKDRLNNQQANGQMTMFTM